MLPADDLRPAGRITERLLSELRGAQLCIADLSNNNPNVMWEVGYAMALDKPIIVVTQQLSALPFDIKDMQSIGYQRTHLSETLGKPLHRVLLDTRSAMERPLNRAIQERDIAMGTLLEEVGQLKQMVGEVVRDSDPHSTKKSLAELRSLTGHWLNMDSSSHIYLRIVRGELVGPYCYGDNTRLTAAYFGCRRLGDYWFARFKWFESPVDGFIFLRQESFDRVSGAWWYSRKDQKPPQVPPNLGGAPCVWKRLLETDTPLWAERFFDDVEREGLESRLALAAPR
jgi:hypothetical protein